MAKRQQQLSRAELNDKIYWGKTMKKSILISTLAIATAAITLPVSAQIDGDYLSDQIEARRLKKLREDQRAIANGTFKSGKRKTRTTSTRKTSQRKVVDRQVQVQVNGRLLQSDAPAIQRGSHTFVPMRNIFEALGATVTYDDKTRIVTAVRDGSGMQLRLEGGSRSDMKGSRERLDEGEAPFVRNGVAMVPLRLVSEKLGAKVAYIARPTTPLISIASKTY